MVILMYSAMLECNLVPTFFHVLYFFSRYRRKHTWTESFTSWIWNPSYDNLTEGTLSCTVLVLVFYLHYNVSQKGLALFLICFVFILVERHAELCYAECLFMRALLTFIQV